MKTFEIIISAMGVASSVIFAIVKFSLGQTNEANVWVVAAIWAANYLLSTIKAKRNGQ